MHDVVINGMGLQVAPEAITNEELAVSYNAYTQRYNAWHTETVAAGELTALVESSAELIEKTSGIRQCYVIDKTGALDPTYMRPRLTPRPDDTLLLQAEIGVVAAYDALTATGRDAAEVDMLLCTTSNFQQPYPAPGVEIQNDIGAGDYAFDMNAACSSATLGLEQAINAVRNGMARAALVVSLEITSGHLDWEDRDCHFIFDDVCMAVLAKRAEDTRFTGAWHVLGTKCAASFFNSIRNNAGYLSRSEDRSPDDRDQFFRQEGHKVFRGACLMAAEHTAGHLQQLNHVPADVRRFWLHQASLTMNQLIGKRLLGHNTSADEAPVILGEFTNAASAGSIITFHHHRASLKPGNLGMIYSFGVDYSIGSVTAQKQ